MLAADQLATELLSFHANLPSGSAIILIAVLIYVLSIALGPWRPDLARFAAATPGGVTGF
jgi:ABC-type Mn2+/Zn2+ transport system permease subunit